MQQTQEAFLKEHLESFREDLIGGLRQAQKRIPSKYLYDDRGSELFDKICETSDYYVTRTELGILREALPELRRLVGPRAAVIEPGAGSGEKVRLLLSSLESPAAVVPLDISEDYVNRSGELLHEAFPEIEILPVCADFTDPPELPTLPGGAERTLVFFPGSTYGNFDAPVRTQLLRSFRKLAHSGGVAGGRLLLGLDLVKDADVLERAYDDSEGVTRAFTRNLFERANRELGADFDLDKLRPGARYNAAERRVELGVVSLATQTVRIGGETIELGEGEHIRTEHSHKFEVDRFLEEEAGPAGMQAERVWTDPAGWFALLLLTIE